MREQLIEFLRRQPFVPFVVTLTGGESYPIETVERMSAGLHVFTLVDPQTGLVLFAPYDAILHLSIKDAPAVR
jgi:hypothetical protein